MGIHRHRIGETSYSESVTVTGHGKWLHIAGQLAFDDERRLIDGDLAAESNRCLDRIDDLVVEAGGSGLGNVVAITVYLLRIDDYPVFDRVRAERFGEHRPASAAVQVAGLLFGGNIEIAATAFVPDE